MGPFGEKRMIIIWDGDTAKYELREAELIVEVVIPERDIELAEYLSDSTRYDDTVEGFGWDVDGYYESNLELRRNATAGTEWMVSNLAYT